jgi:hypothetical protein
MKKLMTLKDGGVSSPSQSLSLHLHLSDDHLPPPRRVLAPVTLEGLDDMLDGVNPRRKAVIKAIHKAMQEELKFWKEYEIRLPPSVLALASELHIDPEDVVPHSGAINHQHSHLGSTTNAQGRKDPHELERDNDSMLGLVTKNAVRCYFSLTTRHSSPVSLKGGFDDLVSAVTGLINLVVGMPILKARYSDGDITREVEDKRKAFYLATLSPTGISNPGSVSRDIFVMKDGTVVDTRLHHPQFISMIEYRLRYIINQFHAQWRRCAVEYEDHVLAVVVKGDYTYDWGSSESTLALVLKDVELHSRQLLNESIAHDAHLNRIAPGIAPALIEQCHANEIAKMIDREAESVRQQYESEVRERIKATGGMYGSVSEWVEGHVQAAMKQQEEFSRWARWDALLNQLSSEGLWQAYKLAAVEFEFLRTIKEVTEVDMKSEVVPAVVGSVPFTQWRLRGGQRDEEGAWSVDIASSFTGWRFVYATCFIAATMANFLHYIVMDVFLNGYFGVKSLLHLKRNETDAVDTKPLNGSSSRIATATNGSLWSTIAAMNSKFPIIEGRCSSTGEGVRRGIVLGGRVILILLVFIVHLVGTVAAWSVCVAMIAISPLSIGFYVAAKGLSTAFIYDSWTSICSCSYSPVLFAPLIMLRGICRIVLSIVALALLALSVTITISLNTLGYFVPFANLQQHVLPHDSTVDPPGTVTCNSAVCIDPEQVLFLLQIKLEVMELDALMTEELQRINLPHSQYGAFCSEVFGSFMDLNLGAHGDDASSSTVPPDDDMCYSKERIESMLYFRIEERRAALNRYLDRVTGDNSRFTLRHIIDLYSTLLLGSKMMSDFIPTRIIGRNTVLPSGCGSNSIATTAATAAAEDLFWSTQGLNHNDWIGLCKNILVDLFGEDFVSRSNCKAAYLEDSLPVTVSSTPISNGLKIYSDLLETSLLGDFGDEQRSIYQCRIEKVLASSTEKDKMNYQVEDYLPPGPSYLHHALFEKDSNHGRLHGYVPPSYISRAPRAA